MREMDVVGVRVEMPSNQPIVLLREVTGERYLPIWIGAVEATAIAFAQQGVTPPRPLTHDLMRDVLEATGQRLDGGADRRHAGRRSSSPSSSSTVGPRSAPGRPTRSPWRCARAPASCARRRCSRRPAWPCPPSRRTRSSGSASSSTTSRPTTSSPPSPTRNTHPQPEVEGCDTPRRGWTTRTLGLTLNVSRCNSTAVVVGSTGTVRALPPGVAAQRRNRPGGSGCG